MPLAETQSKRLGSQRPPGVDFCHCHNGETVAPVAEHKAGAILNLRHHRSTRTLRFSLTLYHLCYSFAARGLKELRIDSSPCLILAKLMKRVNLLQDNLSDLFLFSTTS
jgi:hypothetical protein